VISKPKEGWDREDRVVETARRFGGAASKTLAAGTSGVVRIRAAYGAIVSAIMALMMGWAALAAGLIGGNIPTLIGAGCFSLLLGWLALWNARRAFGRKSPAGAESQYKPAPGTWGNPQAAYANMGNLAGAAETGTPAGGSAICYDRIRLVAHVARLLPACVLLAWVLTRGTHTSPLITLLLLAALGFVLWRIATLLLRATGNDLMAIWWDNHQIRVRTLTSSRQVPWPSVESTRRVRRLWGLIPVSTSHDLVFQIRHNGARRRMTVPATALTIRPGEAEELLRRFALHHARVANTIEGAGDPFQVGNRMRTVQPDPGSRAMDGVPVAEAAPPTQAPDPYDRAPGTPPVFGRKVAS
jgi:hypothetical protein